MQEILPLDSVCQDTYVDALTLGPVPGVVDGADITIDRADVLMQFAVGGQGNNYWGDREYPMRPGTRHVDNIIGVRFRNQQAGAAAIVNASLTDPNLPRLEPIIPITATGVGNVLLSQQVPAATPQSFGPFDVGDWPYLLLGLSSGNAGGSRLTARYPLFGQAVGFVDYSLETLVISAGFSGGPGAGLGLRVVPNLIRNPTLQVDQSGGVQTAIFAAPCAFPRIPHWAFLGQLPALRDRILLHQTTAGIAAGATVTYLCPPYDGQVYVEFKANGGGPYVIEWNMLDYTGATVARVTEQTIAANTMGNFGPLPWHPRPVSIGITNTGALGTSSEITVFALPEFN